MICLFISPGHNLQLPPASISTRCVSTERGRRESSTLAQHARWPSLPEQYLVAPRQHACPFPASQSRWLALQKKKTSLACSSGFLETSAHACCSRTREAHPSTGAESNANYILPHCILSHHQFSHRSGERHHAVHREHPKWFLTNSTHPIAMIQMPALSPNSPQVSQHVAPVRSRLPCNSSVVEHRCESKSGRDALCLDPTLSVIQRFILQSNSNRWNLGLPRRFGPFLTG
ncbi:hypothetical protein B0J11DRAFT_304585 [Dendryphion nanum]|uniref:Uncharacterized protein n=1 Tax=Dendryphion nanum TaxID=256645 RepID=A0A9P9IM23_9PLEO|nr:hypothetical protein B0J11DRAFT_304585 [Dendryphion nanum]